jgi:hypothetical protein
MKKFTLSIFSFCILFSCNNDEPSTVEIVEEGREIGAYIRTTEISSSEFNVGQTASTFSIGLEVQDEEDGDQFDEIEVFLKFQDNTPDNGTMTTTESLYRVLDASEFVDGSFGLPRIDLDFSFEQALSATGMSVENVHCTDQFLVRLNIKLPDGRSFSVGDASSKILAADDFWSSPFCYTINVVEPIESALFTGIYEMTSVVDGPLGPTFGDTQLVTIFEGNSPNERAMKLRHRLSIPQETKRTFRFTVACDEIVMTKNLLSSKIGFCTVDPAILLGPDTVNGPADPNDDSVFELWFVEGYLGFDGNCGFGTAPSRLRFSKQ